MTTITIPTAAELREKANKPLLKAQNMIVERLLKNIEYGLNRLKGCPVRFSMDIFYDELPLIMDYEPILVASLEQVAKTLESGGYTVTHNLYSDTTRRRSGRVAWIEIAW